ncbi:LOW QUALITY PROTEIN: hypothetical protein CRUP_002220 [Coryphaenoides rupestris]|nr:LOW QUALITY PROTEIN: hypothetical protein CRUP_002220 [Coryphaenoides rupestris]
MFFLVEESENEWSVPHCFTIYSAQRTVVAHHRANTTLHVCWHRNTSVSMSDHSMAVENQLSGYLLRKFKNSNGWQKLWVVFTNFCLFFYKTHQVEESENEWSVPHCFTIYSAQRTVVVAASSKVEMTKWIEDLNMAINMSKSSHEKSDIFFDAGLGDRSNRSSDEVSVEQESEDDLSSSHGSLDKQAHHRANTTLHVCWHRNTSVSMSDHSMAVENQLSGYLLRKFKNSNGWQKLWVVFTNFCLFFYKTHQATRTPEEADGIHKDYVFKLQFKSHVYFFRAESEYTFERWMEVIRSAASAAGRMSLLAPPRVSAELNRK